MGILGRRIGAGFLIALMNINMMEVAFAQSGVKNFGPQLMKDISQVDSYSTEFNSKTKNKTRVEGLLRNYENFIGRSLSKDERKFLSLEFATIDLLPNFEVKGNMIHIYEKDKGAKDLLMSIEIVDFEKNTFRFGTRTFTVDPEKPIHENIQLILKEFRKGEKVGLLEQLNPFAVPQAHAMMAPWLIGLLVGGIAFLIAWMVKKKNDKNVAAKESSDSKESSSAEDSNEEALASESHQSNEVVEESGSLSNDSAGEAPVTAGEEPATV